jgi:hypothetical protein
VVRRPSGYSAKHCSKSVLKKDFIPFLSSYVHSSIVTCSPPLPHVVLIVLVLIVLPNFGINVVLDSFSKGRPSTGFRMLCPNHYKMLTPKGLRVFFNKTASKQPLLKTSQMVQNWNQFWYFQLLDLVANFYIYMPTKSHTLIPYNL